MNQLLKAISIMLAGLSADFGDMFKTLGNIPADLAQRLSVAMSPLRNATRGLVQSVKNSPIVADFADMFRTLAEVPNDLRERAARASAWMDKNSAGKRWEPAWNRAKQFGSSVSGAAGSAMSSVGGMLGQLRGGIASAFSSAGLQRLSSNIGALIQPMRSAIGSGLSGIGSVAGGVFRGAMAAGRGVGSVAGGTLRGVAGIGQGLIQVAGRAASVVSPDMGAALTRLGTAAGPAGAAAGLVALYAAVVGLPPLLKAFGNSVAESRRGLVQFNGIIAGAFGAYDARGISRQLESGDRTAATTAFMLQTQSDVFDDLQKPLDAMSNISNLTWTVTSSILNEVVKILRVTESLEAIASALAWWQGVNVDKPQQVAGGQDFGRDLMHKFDTEWRPRRPPVRPIGGGQ